MAKKKLLDQNVKKFVDAISKGLRVQHLIFYGSRAQGKHTRWSDYDFIIVSPDFEEVDFLSRITKMYDYWPNYDYPVEPLGYTPKEYKRAVRGINIVSEAAKTGIHIIYPQKINRREELIVLK